MLQEKIYKQDKDVHPFRKGDSIIMYRLIFT